MDARLEPVPFVAPFAASVRPVADVVGFYAGGSLAFGDYQPGRSDLDLVAIVAADLDGSRRERLRRLHEDARCRVPGAAKLHCVYVPVGAIADVGARHLTWAHGRLIERAFSGISRAEVLQTGITVLGPAPAQLVPRLDGAALRRAALVEVNGYWACAVRWPWLWLDDVHVDLGLLTLARAEATLSEGRLITKAEALTRLDRLGVHEDLADEMSRRRRGVAVRLSPAERVRRARTVRRLVARSIRALNREGSTRDG